MSARPKSRIAGTGAYVPEKVLSNLDIEKLVDTSDEWIRERTGIGERRVAAEGEASSDMAVKAAKRALEAAGIGPDDLDMIVVGTISADMPLPACAAFVQQKLGCRKKMHARQIVTVTASTRQLYRSIPNPMHSARFHNCSRSGSTAPLTWCRVSPSSSSVPVICSARPSSE
jgi:hypothetical protein